MSDYLFRLNGSTRTFSGRGVDTYKSSEFTLESGTVVVQIAHHGDGDFKLRFVATNGGLGAVAATGAAIGSIVPGLGTIAGGVIGGVVGSLEGKVLKPVTWTPAETTGRFSKFDMVQVTEYSKGALSPGNYRLEVESNARWECRFIQPGLGQIGIPLPYHVSERQGGMYFVAPISVPARPLLAKAYHNARGKFFVRALPLDGSHEQVNFINQTGQTLLEDQPTQMLPGKEYIVQVAAGGGWGLELYEGY